MSAEVRVIASAESWIEGTAVQQLEKTATLPGMRLAVGLPDLHPGKGTPIGAAFAAEGWIYPLLVGNDIGCGVALWRTSLAAAKAKREGWANALRRLDDAWDGDAALWLEDRGVDPAAYLESVGTIGGGNHFAELQDVWRVDDAEAAERIGISKEAVYLLVHSGSRGLGEAILREHVERFRADGLAAGSVEATEYLARHNHAIRWAAANRELIARRMLDRLHADGHRLLDVCHNWVEQVEIGGHGCWLHRKGAAPSTCGPVVIPGSRGDLSYVVQPVNPTERSAWSLAHGAGRKWGRSDTRGRLEKRFKAKDLTRTAMGSHVICEDKDLLYEEAPEAYKNINRVIMDLEAAGLIRVIAIMRPLVTYKVRRQQ
jgi:release factor H-coupled RctB family protein